MCEILKVIVDYANLKNKNNPPLIKLHLFQKMTKVNSIQSKSVYRTIPAIKDDFSGHFFRNFEIIIFCFVVAICDLVYDVESILYLSYVLKAYGNLF